MADILIKFYVMFLTQKQSSYHFWHPWNFASPTRSGTPMTRASTNSRPRRLKVVYHLAVSRKVWPKVKNIVFEARKTYLRLYIQNIIKQMNTFFQDKELVKYLRERKGCSWRRILHLPLCASTGESWWTMSWTRMARLAGQTTRQVSISRPSRWGRNLTPFTRQLNQTIPMKKRWWISALARGRRRLAELALLQKNLNILSFYQPDHGRFWRWFCPKEKKRKIHTSVLNLN